MNRVSGYREVRGKTANAISQIPQVKSTVEGRVDTWMEWGTKTEKAPPPNKT